jgi:hypothetical protein
MDYSFDEVFDEDPHGAWLGDDALSPEEQAQLSVTQTQASAAMSQPGGGGDAVHDQVIALKRAVIEEAAKSVALSTGLSVAALATSETPIGWILAIIAALIALIKLFTGPYVKRKIQEIVNASINELSNYGEAKEVEASAKAIQVTSDEWPAAQRLAVSNQPLDGWLRDAWNNAGKAITDAARVVAKPIAKPLVQMNAAPLRWAGDQTIKSWVMIAKVLGQDKTADKLNHFDAEWKQHMDHATQQAEAMLADPVMGVRVMHGYPFRLITGLSQEDQVRKRAYQLVAQGKAQIATRIAQIEATLDGAQYRSGVRNALAKAIRANPQLLADAQTAVAQAPISAPASGGGGLLSTLALIGGFFWLNK